MPVDLEKIKNLSLEQNKIKRHPKSYRTKQKQLQNLTHWVVVANGKAVSAITNFKLDLDLFIEARPEYTLTLQKLICHNKIQCECGLESDLSHYKFKEIYYCCNSGHITKISEYA